MMRRMRAIEYLPNHTFTENLLILLTPHFHTSVKFHLTGDLLHRKFLKLLVLFPL